MTGKIVRLSNVINSRSLNKRLLSYLYLKDRLTERQTDIRHEFMTQIQVKI